MSDRLARPGNVNVKEGNIFLDVARPPSRDPPPGDRLPGAPRSSLRSAGPEIRPGVGARPGNVKEDFDSLCWYSIEYQYESKSYSEQSLDR